MPARPTHSNGSRRMTGMALMALAMLMVPGLDAIAKVLMDRLPPLQVAFGRFLAQSLVLFPLFMMTPHVRSLKPGHVTAGLFLGLAMLSFNHALRVMPIANALAIFFVEPLILTLLAALVLRELLSLRRLIAIGVGLVGALIVLRPNFSAYGATALLPLATAFLFACFMLCTRKISQSGDPLALQFWTGVFAAAALLIALGLSESIFGATEPVLMPNTRELSLFVLLGLLAGFAHQLIIRSLSLIEAGHAASFQYLEIVSAVILGWVIFDDFPDMLTLIGAGVIVGSGLFVVKIELRERKTVEMQ